MKKDSKNLPGTQTMSTVIPIYHLPHKQQDQGPTTATIDSDDCDDIFPTKFHENGDETFNLADISKTAYVKE